MRGLIFIVFLLFSCFGCSMAQLFDSKDNADKVVRTATILEKNLDGQLLGKGHDDVISLMGKPVNERILSKKGVPIFRGQEIFENNEIRTVNERGQILVDELWVYNFEYKTARSYDNYAVGVYFYNGRVVLVNL